MEDVVKDMGQPPLLSERTGFVVQLLSKSAIKVKANTTYEEIGCVGFQPEFNRLEAVVYIKQPIGYNGNICSSGSIEYVRFFISLNGGSTWQDQGVAKFTAYNIPEAAKKRLEYAVTLKISPKKKFCFNHNVVLARAILSWNLEPPANDPNFMPPWGNVHDTHIQIDPIRLIPIGEMIAEAKLKLPEQIAQVVDMSKLVQVAPKKSLTIAELHSIYKDKKVEPHRFGFKMAQKMISDPEFAAGLVAGIKGDIPQLKLDWSAILKALSEPDGNTIYEELECVGLNPNSSELIATFRIKRSSGYSGGPCTNGSTEYVTFWGDFDMDGTFEQCLGTTNVTVYDFDDIPDKGLEYSVFLPVNLNQYRQSCQKGPKVARIRAILSWNKPHSCSKPKEPPFWGNAEDTVILIPPGPKVEPADFSPYIYTLCSVNVCTIDQSTGQATGDRPFGGNIWITGEFPNGPAITVPDRFKYKVSVRPLDQPGTWQPLTNSFWITYTEGSVFGPTTTDNILQEVDSDGYYTYREYGTPITGNWRRITGPDRALALWCTSSSYTGRWEIKIEGLDTLTGLTYDAGIQVCSKGYRQNVIVKLDQVPPSVVLAITEYERPGEPGRKPASKCDKFRLGDIIYGKYDVSDEHFRKLTLSILPVDYANGVQVDPASRTYYLPDLVSTNGESGEWKIVTTNMKPCGFIVLLEAWDRTIENCDADGWYSRTSVGFCLEAQAK
jgi:hypothetical protein